MSFPKSHKHSRSHRPAGQALVEFALLLPLLLVLVISAIEFGRLFYTQIVITNAAREGAYYFSTHTDDYTLSDLKDKTALAAEVEAGNSGIPNITVITNDIDCCTLGQFKVEVTVNTVVENLIILGLINNSRGVETRFDQFPLSATVEMVVQ